MNAGNLIDELEDFENQQWECDQPEWRHEENLRTSSHVAGWNLGDGIANDEQGSWDRNVANPVQWFGDDAGWMPLQGDNQNGKVSADQTWRIEPLPDAFAFLFACYELRSPNEDSNCVWNIQY